MAIKTVLLVDDDPTIRLIGQISLGECFTVVEAESGEEALDILEREKPDLILLDVNMPGLGGYATLAKQNECEEDSKIPVILLTGTDQSDEVKRCLKIGAIGAINKQIDPLTWPTEIGKILKTKFPEHAIATQRE